ncbi:SYP2 protein [Gonium pectorale]|uniref:SYP2 protein n=1 Tax=Gonium pectorale TaxID=33097 RepID=A0A150GU95_GONPE|nr:SYP2 protein [Gonium pectorale]|eukprot:KXZ53409.1 SYP2 protein [Gonium pectorale]
MKKNMDATKAPTVPILEEVQFPSGVRGLPFYALLPLTTAYLVFSLFKDFLKNPLGFFSSKERRPEQLPLPAYLEGLVHEHLDVGGGVKLHAVGFGRQPGKPLLLFLHGFPECWYSWREQLAALRDRYEVLAVDMRGYNTSSKPKGLSAYTLERLTADVAAVVRGRGRSSCTLVAHDWGGVVAWTAAGRYPGLVDRLVVLAAPHWLLYLRNRTADQMARSYYFLWFLLPVLPELLLTHTDSAFTSSLWLSGADFGPLRRGANSPADAEVYKAAALQPGAATSALNYYRALLLTNLGLLPLHPEVAPRCQVHVLQECSHWIQSDKPAELQRILDDWLKAHPLGKAEDNGQ